MTIKPTYEELKKKVKVLEDILAKSKQIEESLHDTEKLYRLLFDHSPEGIVIVDPATTRFLDFNETVCLQHGYSREEFSQLSIFDLEADETPEKIQSHIKYVIKRGISDFETRHHTKQGEIINLHVTAQYTDVLGKPVYHCIWRDITDRKRMETALKESERRLADIIDFLPDPTYAIDLSGKVIVWNHAIEEMTGVKAKDMLGKGNHEYIIPFYGTPRPVLIDLVFKSNEELEKKYDFVKRDGDVLLAEAEVPVRGVPHFLWGKAGPLYDSHGKVVGAIESVRDITELRQAREALQKSHDELEIRVQKRTAELVQANKALEAEISERKRAEEKILILANLSDISPLSISVYDLQGNLLYANQKTFDMHGYSKKEFLARNLHEIDVPSSAALIEERKKEVLETGEARFNVEHYRKDGTCFPLEVFLKATKWRGQTVLLSVASDITERRRVEEELRKYRKGLETLVSERTSELENKTNNLQEVNTALNVLLQKREEDKKIMEERFVANIGTLVLPYVEKIRKNNLDVQQQFCLDTIEKNLDEIASPLLKNIQQFNLTPREFQVASLIKDGKTTKEIADILGIVEGSIATHRKNIRKKLGLERTSNLQSQLRFFEK
ncbi:MAG: PAS domain S-box protein [Smithella sp.]